MNIPRLSRFTHNDDFKSVKKARIHKESLGEATTAGAVGGAAIGALAGATHGYFRALNDLRSPVVDVHDETYFSTKRDLVGASYDDSDIVTRWDHTEEEWVTEWEDAEWNSITERRDVKQYQRPHFHNHKSGVFRTVGSDALKGALVGGVVGAIGTTAVSAAGLDKLPSPTILENTATSALLGGVTGAVIGGFAGHHAGTVAQENALREVRTAPTYEWQQIGWKPRVSDARAIAEDLGKGSGDFKIYYDELGEKYGSSPFEGKSQVKARIPVGEHEVEYRSSSLTPLKGTLLGIGGGAVFGVAVGAATSVLHRVLTSEAPSY